MFRGIVRMDHTKDIGRIFDILYYGSGVVKPDGGDLLYYSDDCGGIPVSWYDILGNHADYFIEDGDGRLKVWRYPFGSLGDMTQHQSAYDRLD